MLCGAEKDKQPNRIESTRPNAKNDGSSSFMDQKDGLGFWDFGMGVLLRWIEKERNGEKDEDMTRAWSKVMR